MLALTWYVAEGQHFICQCAILSRIPHHNDDVEFGFENLDVTFAERKFNGYARIRLCTDQASTPDGRMYF
jgi:hypothetical protein